MKTKGSANIKTLEEEKLVSEEFKRLVESGMSIAKAGMRVGIVENRAFILARRLGLTKK